MTTIKSYTDLEQSKVLANILPLESADMYWRSLNLNGHISWSSHFKRLEPPIYDLEHYIPCWSLAALLRVLPNYQLQTQDDGIGILCSCNGKFNIITADNPIDACYEMILKLHEHKML